MDELHGWEWGEAGYEAALGQGMVSAPGEEIHTSDADNGRDGMTVDGKPWRQYLKEVSFRTEIPEFREMLARIGGETNITLDEMRRRFGNKLLDDVVFGES